MTPANDSDSRLRAQLRAAYDTYLESEGGVDLTSYQITDVVTGYSPAADAARERLENAIEKILGA